MRLWILWNLVLSISLFVKTNCEDPDKHDKGDTEENDGSNDDTAGAGAEQVQQSKPFLSLGMAW